MNLVQNLRHRAELQPGVPAIVDRIVRGDRVISFVAFNRSVDFLALRLREEGVEPGHKVLLALDPNQEFYLFALALLQIGASPVICGKALGSSFLTDWIENARPHASKMADPTLSSTAAHYTEAPVCTLFSVRESLATTRTIWPANRIEPSADCLD
jgi:non-ribosomal peptide synthetase component E (peptide arylation enzyme)